MNCTDRIGVGLVLLVGGVWLDAAGLPGAVVPVYGLPVFLLGLGLFAHAMWQAGRLVIGADGSRDEETHRTS